MAILVCPLARAHDITRDRRPSHAVSLLDPGTPFPELGLGERHFQLQVHDIDLALPGHTHCAEDHIERIIGFIESWGAADPILVHCYAGISRSTATAYITACVHNPYVDEEEIAFALRKASPTATPNRRFIALADAALGRSGRMTRAIEAIGRGPPWYEVGEAAPFSLPAKFT